MRPKKEINYDYDSLRQLPMVVGLLAPLCILLSIPPITGSWECEDLICDTRKLQDNPTILTLLCTGLACLFSAHVALMFRFLERHVVLTTWLSILGYFLNFCFTLSAVLYFRFNFTLSSGKSFSGEYYAAYASTIISFFISLFLMIDFFKNNQLRGKGSGLSRNQRVLVFMAILVAIWAVIGALTAGYLESWPFTRGIYFVLVTTTTIGFGDYAPTTMTGQIFCIFYAAIGIILVGMLIAFIRSVILESFESVYYQRLEQLGIFRLETLTSSNFQSTSDNSISMTVPTDDPNHILKRPMTALEQQKALKNAQISQYIRQLGFSSVAVLLFWLIGAAIFSAVEGWDYFKAFYYCFISFTTIGYGDVTVKSFQGVVIFCVYILIGLVTMAYFLSVATELFSCIIDSHSDRIERKRFKKTNTIDELNRNKIHSPVGDPIRNLELVEALEKETGDEERDLIQKLLAMTEFYHQEVTYFVKNIIEDEEHNHFNENEKYSIHLQKLEKYEKIYDQLISLCKKKLNTQELIITEVEEPLAVHQSPVLKNESVTHLIQQ